MHSGYIELKLSHELYHKAPDALNPAERQRIAITAARQHELEKRILASAEAALVHVPAATLQNRLDEIARRYPDQTAMEQDLASIGLNNTDLAEAVERDLRIEAVLDKIAATATPATRVDAEIYYHLHPAAFNRPETRRLRHILITFENYGERQRQTALLEGLRPSLYNLERFAEAALRYSHCPSALEGGQLGVIGRGQLYPELEPAAFALAEGEISEVLESPIGLHLLYCEAIPPSGPIPFEEVVERIIDRLDEQRRRKAQRQWIAALPHSSSSNAKANP